MQTQGTRPLRAAEAINGARAYRRQCAFRDDLATRLHALHPGIARVHLTPVVTDVNGEARRQTLVSLYDSVGYAVAAPLGAHRAARLLILDAFPAADWSVPQIFNAAYGVLAVNLPEGPADLGIETAPAVTA
ncbi:hypothetical protein ABZT27_37965 [Streptomyces sp. NPDC005389]|uniref:hypothetical protein n=1 Tax=Streptomyces sp. NPDC005389 TaxID=3157040 RepID=UPI0033A4648B